jgi:opacity protein-like surface antigen
MGSAGKWFQEKRRSVDAEGDEVEFKYSLPTDRLGEEDGEVYTQDSGGQLGEISGKLKTTAVMLNGWYDFENKSRFTPYIGVGFGQAKVSGSYSGKLNGYRNETTIYRAEGDKDLPADVWHTHGTDLKPDGTPVNPNPLHDTPVMDTTLPSHLAIDPSNATPTDINHQGSGTALAYQIGLGVAFQATENVMLDVGYRYFSTGKVDFTGESARNHSVMAGLRVGF